MQRIRSETSEIPPVDEVSLARGKVLPYWFYDRPTALVSCDLLGKILVHNSKDGLLAGMITEVEAYFGVHDPACHASYGPTPRKKIFYNSAPGTVYVFRSHAYSCLNVLTGGDTPLGCVLIRAAQPLIGTEIMRKRRQHAKNDHDIASGPGNLGRAFDISMRLNYTNAFDGPVRIVDLGLAGFSKTATPRIGISTAVDYPFRYFIDTDSSVSRRPNKLY